MSRVLLGVTGGIAAYKSCELLRMLVRAGHEVRVMVTESALAFVAEQALATLSGHRVRHRLLDPAEEAEISHIALADWAEVVAIAPATAHTLARLAHGMADDLVTTVCLATRAPLVLAPAMNVNMYRHPATQENLAILTKRGAALVGPESGELACGWEGEGRLASLPEIAGVIERAVGPGDLRGEVVLVSAGPTAEPIDPVRVITNRSSGKMGFAIAQEAARRGAEVCLVSGPVALPTPHGVSRVDVETMSQMRDAVLECLPRATIVILAAAVGDYRAAEVAPRKIKRSGDSLVLALVPNADIAAEIGAMKGSRVLVGFAAETHDMALHALGKMQKKGCDLMVANDVSRSDIGFGADRNEVLLIGPRPEDRIPVESAPKLEVASRILDRVLEIRAR
jgi:phosphopantothenoylcysteine decarboxylase / phosphopantothenate---cysteine ligase